MSYMPKKRAFNLTLTKMKYWHRHAKHYPPKHGCVFCEGDMEKVAEFLTSKGLKVIDQGHAWVTIEAVKNYRPVAGGRTDETDFLF